MTIWFFPGLALQVANLAEFQYRKNLAVRRVFLKRIREIWFGSILLIFLPNAAAQQEDDSAGWVTSGFNWLQTQRDLMSRTVTATSRAMDEYFARDTFESSLVNESYVQLVVRQSFASGYENDGGVRLRARLHVPNTENKINLFIDSNPDDYNSITERRQGSDISTRESTELGISFWRNVNRKWNPSLSFSVKSSPLEPVTRLRLRRHFSLGRTWGSRVANRASYRDSTRWVNTSRLDFYRPFDDAILTINSEAQFTQQREDESDPRLELPDSNYYEFFHGWSYAHQLDDDRSITWSFGLNAINKPTLRMESAWFRADWRKLLHDDWLFLKVTPQVSFPRDRDFRTTYAVYLELEVYIGEQFDARRQTRLVPTAGETVEDMDDRFGRGRATE